MEDHDADRSGSSRRLAFSRENFDDYLCALMSKLRANDVADRILSGELPHPLIAFQQINAANLVALNVPYVSPRDLLSDPVGPYVRWLRILTDALLRAAAPVPAMVGLAALQVAQNEFRTAERYIFSNVVSTLRVGESMHYARQCIYGAGQLLLQSIINDNRQTTTRSLMAVFSALLSLSLRDKETFEQFERRIGLLIQRLRNWRPPVVLPEQLLLFCALRALPVVPYGPVRHIILASPTINYYSGMAMLRDVANTGAELIASTLGSGVSSSKSAAAVLCAPECDDSHHPPNRRARRRKKRAPHPPANSPKPRYLIEGPCKHHGPDSKHATSECRDPTLARRKKRDPQPTPPQSSSAAMYSPVFVTRISRSAAKFPRGSFRVANRHVPHFRRSRRRFRGRRFNISSVSQPDLVDCVRSYTAPVKGTPVHPRPWRQARSSLQHSGSFRQSSRSREARRRRRRRSNRRAYYPEGHFSPPKARPPRPFNSYNKNDARRRRARRRRMTTPPVPPSITSVPAPSPRRAIRPHCSYHSAAACRHSPFINHHAAENCTTSCPAPVPAVSQVSEAPVNDCQVATDLHSPVTPVCPVLSSPSEPLLPQVPDLVPASNPASLLSASNVAHPVHAVTGSPLREEQARFDMSREDQMSRVRRFVEKDRAWREKMRANERPAYTRLSDDYSCDHNLSYEDRFMSAPVSSRVHASRQREPQPPVRRDPMRRASMRSAETVIPPVSDPVPRPDYACGTVNVLANPRGSGASLFFSLGCAESSITDAALPVGTILVPRSQPPNAPGYPVGLSSFCMTNIAVSCPSFTHYAILDLQVAVHTASIPTVIRAIPLRVLHSKFPAVVLGTNDIVK